VKHLVDHGVAECRRSRHGYGTTNFAQLSFEARP
jgi:hypothetical protein